MGSENEIFHDEVVDKIDGWLVRVTSLRTMDLLDFQERNDIKGGMLEIGVYHGKYFSVLARSAQRRSEKLIGIYTFQWRSEADVISALSRSIETSGANIELLKCFSHECTASDLIGRLGGAARFISIDGSHDAPDVLFDLELCEQVVSPSGVVAVDDFINPVAIGVNEGVHLFFARPRRIVPFAYIDNKLFLAHRSMVDSYRQFTEQAITQDQHEAASQTFRERNATSRHLVEQRLWGFPVLMCPY